MPSDCFPASFPVRASVVHGVCVPARLVGCLDDQKSPFNLARYETHR